MAIIAPDWNPVAASPTEPRAAWFSPDGEAAILAHVRAQAAACFSLVDIDLPLFNQASDAGLTIIGRETWNACGHLTETGLVGRDVHDRLLMSAKITDAQLADAEAVRQSFAAAVDNLLETFVAIALPAMTHSVPSLLEIASTAAPKPITLA
ncbi:MAG: amidase, partial [bacterium]